ncbi:hypothetical protein PAPYR_6532 [Paratrimastix pyriformis]|uniref:Protein HGH1 homolog n=1 Tax=Paratrimastix pyriformis TaxID=342808 RepID=A0ABQ8UF01_9EUKA|nr:hypothetical protein PAPYR_6532 [Paratrimastix pyriformis]
MLLLPAANKVVLGEAGALPVVLDILDTAKESALPELAAECCRVIRNLVSLDANRARLAEVEDSLEMLADTLRQFRGNSEVAVWLCGALAILAEQPELRQRLRGLDVLDMACAIEGSEDATREAQVLAERLVGGEDDEGHSGTDGEAEGEGEGVEEADEDEEEAVALPPAAGGAEGRRGTEEID